MLEVTPQTLQWRRGEPCWVDVAEFKSAVEEADGAEAGSDGMVAALRTAAALYAGDLLEGCYDEWLIDERERLRDRYFSVLHRLTSTLADRAEYVDAIRLGRELARREPLHEDTYRFLMRVHEAADDRAGAVRVYHECAAMLQRELGVEPSAATRDAYAALTRSEQSITDAPEPVRVGGAALVGRDSEWDQLIRCWRDVEGGRSQLVLVTGEAGVGKTRLVEELSVWCAHRGAVVAHARAYPTEGDLGYGTVISWLRNADLAAQLRRAGPAETMELARLLPELGLPGETIPSSTDETERRRRLFDAVARTFMASDRPTLLVADDAQWSDAQSLQLIHYLVRVNPTSPLLVVATVRREEIDDDHPLADLVGALQIIDRTTEVGLGRLSRASTEALARDLTGDDLDAEHVDELFAETEGSPLFIVESIRAGNIRGRERPALSPKLHAVISARLRQLSEPARDVLGIAATAGRAFTPALLAEATEMDDVTMVRSLDELWRRGVIREHGSDAYDFTHGKIRDVAYDALSPAQRRRMHLLVAEALQRLHEFDLDSVSGHVASNYDRGGDAARAATWYLRAAQEAQRMYANVEALRLLDRARVLVSDMPGEEDRRRELEILSALPAPLVSVDGFASDRLDEVQRRAVELASILGVALEPSLLRSFVMSSLCHDNFDEAQAAAESLRAAAQRGSDEGLDIESEYLLGIIAFWCGAFATAREHFEQVVNGFSPNQRAEHLLRFGHDPAVVCLSRLGNTLWFLGEDEAARRARDGAVALAVAVGHPLSRDTAFTFAGLLSVDLDDRDRFREFATAISSNAGDRSRPIEINAMAFAGYIDVIEGRAVEGVRRIRSAIDVCGPRNHAPGFRATLMRLLLGAHVIIGDPESGLAAADEALRLDGTRIWEAENRRLRAEFLAGLGGDRADVDAELARAAEIADQQGALGLARRVASTRARLVD
jgi:tetratricopeptide (TPR) repeat protein